MTAPTATDYYDELGVARTASPEEIQRAYRKLARQYHPDVNTDPGAEDRFKAISEAHQVLSNPETRKRYDDFGPDFRHVPDGVDAETWRRARRSQDAGGQGFGGQGFGDDRWTYVSDEGSGFDGIDLEDLLGGMFAGQGRGGTRGRSGFGPLPGADQEADLDITLAEAYAGGTRAFTITAGAATRTVDVTIPAGVVDGKRIRLAGQGGQGSGGAANGDLYLRVHVTPEPGFRLDGRDVTATLAVPPWDAALGASVPVTTPTGRVTVKVPAGTSSGRRLRLRGRGIPNPRGDAGDLYAEIRIATPTTLTDRQRELFTELAATASEAA